MNDLVKLKKERAILRTVVAKYVNKLESGDLENCAESKHSKRIFWLFKLNE